MCRRYNVSVQLQSAIEYSQPGDYCRLCIALFDNFNCTSTCFFPPFNYSYVTIINNLTTYVFLVEFMAFGALLCGLLFLMNIVSYYYQTMQIRVHIYIPMYGCMYSDVYLFFFEKFRLKPLHSWQLPLSRYQWFYHKFWLFIGLPMSFQML